MYSTMFYQEAKINNILKCQKCNSTLDEARLLPCGNTICSSCTLEIEYIQKSSQFTCRLCSKEHIIPKEGFPFNLALASLMNEKPDEIYRSELVEELKLNLNSLQKDLLIFDVDIKSGIDKITEHCTELKRLVQLSTEEKILEINRLNEMFINQIDMYEKETKEKFTKKELDLAKTNKLNEIVKGFIQETQEYLNGFKINDKQVKTANEKAKLHKSNIKEEIERLNSLIFDDLLLKFEMNNSNLSSSVLGEVKYKSLTNSNENIPTVYSDDDDENDDTHNITDENEDEEEDDDERDNDDDQNNDDHLYETDEDSDFEIDDDEDDDEDDNYIEMDDTNYSNDDDDYDNYDDDIDDDNDENDFGDEDEDNDDDFDFDE